MSSFTNNAHNIHILMFREAIDLSLFSEFKYKTLFIITNGGISLRRNYFETVWKRLNWIRFWNLSQRRLRNVFQTSPQSLWSFMSRGNSRNYIGTNMGVFETVWKRLGDGFYTCREYVSERSQRYLWLVEDLSRGLDL